MTMATFDIQQKMSRSKDPKLIFNSRKIHHNQGQGIGKDETQVVDSMKQYRQHDQLSIILASDHTKPTSVDVTDEERRLTSQDIGDISRLSNPKDLSGTFEATDNLDAEGKTYACEDIPQAKPSQSSTIAMVEGDAVIGEEIIRRNKTSQIADSTVKTRTETDDSKIVGMKGGKVYGCTVIGEEVTSRNNTSLIADSVVKLRNETGGSEIVGMEGGESYESTIIGKKTVSEGNNQTIERSHLDIDGDPSDALQPLLIQSVSGHDGDGGGGVSIKDTTIIINGTGGQSDDTSNNQKEFADTTEDLKQGLQNTINMMKQEDDEMKLRVTGLEKKDLETNGRVKKLAAAFEMLKKERDDMKDIANKVKDTLSGTVHETKELRDTVQDLKKTVSNKGRRVMELVKTIEEIKEQDCGIKHRLNVLADTVEGLKVKDLDFDQKVNELKQTGCDTNRRVKEIEDTLYWMKDNGRADKTELTDDVSCLRQELEDTKRQLTKLWSVVDTMMSNNSSRGIEDLSRAATGVAVVGIGATAIAGVVAAPAVVGTAAVGTLGYIYGKVKKFW